MIVCHFCRGELHSPSHDTDVIPYLRYNINHCRDAMPRVFFPDRFQYKFTHFHLVLNQDLQDGAGYLVCGRVNFQIVPVN